MHAQRLIANSSHADIFVIIHQNSFGKSSVRVTQAFYFNEPDNSQKLATYIQNRICKFIDHTNKFKPKANNNYYVLKQPVMPAVLVKCGCLTNYNERTKLLGEDY